MSFEKIVNDIKTIKIQGATNVAIAGLKAISIKNDTKSINKLLKARPTEPLLQNVIKYSKDNPKIKGKFALAHINESKEQIGKTAAKKIKKSAYTHCHSSNVIEAFKQAKKAGKKFRVHCTETRPLYQGRKTAKDCRKLKIKTCFYPDSAGRLAIKQADVMLIGADAITPKRILNKIGSELFVETAVKHGVPVYVLSDSWKYTPKTIKIEDRSPYEVWKNPPKGLDVVNHAFEQVNPKLITGIISELGTMKHKQFIKAVPKTYPDIYLGKKR